MSIVYCCSHVLWFCVWSLFLCSTKCPLWLCKYLAEEDLIVFLMSCDYKFLCLFLAVSWVALQCVIVVFPDHAHLLLDLSITNDIVSFTIDDKRYDLNFDIVNFPFLDGDVPRSLSYGVYISQYIFFKSMFKCK